jgi:hypothetical protein
MTRPCPGRRRAPPSLRPLEASRHVWSASVGNDGHGWGGYRGLAPNLRLDSANVPFAGLRVTRDESVPAFSQASADPPLPPTVTGTFHHHLLWSATWLPWDGAPLDTPQQWQVALCAVAAGAVTCGGGAPQQVAVTPRRLQHFVPVAGAPYTWENWSMADSAVVAHGVITTGADGLLTTPPIAVSPTGNRLLLIPGATPTTLDFFTATVDAGNVTLTWGTEVEAPGALFYIQRATARDGVYVRIDAGPTPATGAPGVYTLTERPPGGGMHYYRLESVDGAGVAHVRGPLVVTVNYQLFLLAIRR